MTKKVHWDENAMPYSGTLDQVLYEIRQSDSGENLLLDAVSIAEIIADSDGVLALDALVTPYIKLQRKMEILQGVMERMGTGIKPVAMQITEPFKQFGVANVAVVYELSDGQTVSIYFHNPDATPNKLAPGDDVISYKWLLNKKDITIVVAPERSQDLNIREVARRILKLAEKNSPAFARANAKRADRMQNIQTLKDEIVTLEGELKTAQNELEIAKVSKEENLAKTRSSFPEISTILRQNGFNVGTVLSGDISAMKYSLGSREATIAARKEKLPTGHVWHVSVSNSVSGGLAITAQHSFNDSPNSIEYPETINDLVAWLSKYGDSNDNNDEATAVDLPDNQAVVETSLNPTSPEDYAKIMADPELQLKYQDGLDALFQERVAAIFSALLSLGWSEQRRGEISKANAIANFDFKHVGAGRNVVGMFIGLIDKTTDVAMEWNVKDDLTKTPEQLAAEVDAAVPIPSNSTELNPVTSKIEVESEDMKAAREFLKSVIDGDKDKDDLMALLDKIEASANAIIEAGKGEEFDARIGQAAEKWAALDQQTNG